MLDKALLQGKVAVVTGGSRGIGRAIVEQFLLNGAVVHYFSRTEGGSLEYFRNQVPGADVTHHEVDVSNEEALQAAFEEIFTLREGIDILVNNAGITRDGLIMRMSLEDWETVQTINLTSAFLASRAVARHMIKRRSGSIINITSVVGKIGNAGQANYAASKAGLIGFTKSLARETASRGVRVNAVAPGFIATEMTEKLSPQQQEQLTEQIPLGRIGEAGDVAGACLFLASDMASYITGEILTVGGGLAM
ncbi:3-oxoacyl-[acyl-carrier-protein] reductase [Alkalispirochaeta americana]|uniref:3-oxoacyl-[acyl-carrier-protein] reductase n=1 Tax=Alkalispirochaeta americana TaxID=159291 RepID=A0A1N6V8U7_9SPIO|nr:3-oxoacyl-[acyl-carrier-protein] reductase [Alkalispirochaeta americana]